MRAELDRHVLPHELPEEPAQRTLRWGARRWALRGQTRDALRLGRGLSRQSAYPRRSCGNAGPAACRGPAPAGVLVLVAGGARESHGDRPRRLMIFEDEPVPGYPLPIL